MSAQTMGTRRWTHKSVVEFSAGRDPVTAMITKANEVAIGAMEMGWKGPPFDPVALAEILGIPVTPASDVVDARTVPTASGVRIEYNPARPKARIRYSIAHEIAHTLFPDCSERVRHRQDRTDMRLDDWQLETLCNIGAAELLMPVGSLDASVVRDLRIDHILELRRQFEVSVEAIMLRLIKLTAAPCLMFAASRQGGDKDFYQVDYSVPSRNWTLPQPSRPSRSSVVGECVAIGHTAKGKETWPDIREILEVECVGVQPQPQQSLPRVLGLICATSQADRAEQPITFLRGDATLPRGQDSKLIVHVVNDGSPNWGAGFARAIKTRYPTIQKSFQEWVGEDRKRLKLGNVHVEAASEDIRVCQMIAQKGFGPSNVPRIRYSALQECLLRVAGIANAENRSIHMPRIGCGEAGGSWPVVEELINTYLVGRGLRVTVYDLPNAGPVRTTPTLF